jgi:hypothetical protein
MIVAMPFHQDERYRIIGTPGREVLSRVGATGRARAGQNRKSVD